MYIKTAAWHATGTILAQKIRTINDSGGYRGSGVVVIFLSWGYGMLTYRIPNLVYEGYSVYTNNTLHCPQRGHGRRPRCDLRSSPRMDMIAEELGIDPIEIRLRNARKPGEILPNGDPLKNYGLIECIEEAARRVISRAKYGKSRREQDKDQQKGSHIKRGIGIGLSSYMGGSLIYPNSSSVIVKLNDDATVSLITGALDLGQGPETILCRLWLKRWACHGGYPGLCRGHGDNNAGHRLLDQRLTYVTGNAAKLAAETR